MVDTRAGRAKDAVALFRKVVGLTPQAPDAHVNLGIALADIYDIPGALAAFTEATRLAPKHAQAWYNKGRAEYDLREYPTAIASLSRAVQLDPNAAEALYLLAVSEKQMNRPDDSRRHLEQLVQLQPRHADALYLLGQNHNTAGRTAEAIALWRKAVDVNGDHSEALYNLIRALGPGDPAAASSYRAKFTELQRQKRITGQAETLNNFALSAAASRDWPRAIEQLTEAITLCGDCRARADLHKNLGLIYARSGDTAKAVAALRAAREQKPADPEIERALQLLQ